VGGGLPILSILSGNGDGTFAEKQDFPALTSLESLVVGDLNGDGKPDVVVIYFAGESTLSVFLNTTVVTDTTPPRITVVARPRVLWPPNGKMIPVVFPAKSLMPDPGLTHKVSDSLPLMSTAGFSPQEASILVMTGATRFRLC